MGVYEAAKDALKAAQKADNIELIQKVMDVQKEALDMQDKMREKNEEIDKLKDEYRKLSDKLLMADTYILDLNVYWKKEDNERKQPFCPACYARGVISPMEPTYQNTRDTSFRCPVEKNHHSNPYNYQPSQAVTSDAF
jgi:hypothetical protein